MPDIEDIIENLAPFAFVLIWILSAVFGRNKDQPPAKTSSPVFAPPPKAKPRGAELESATVSTSGRSGIDWDIQEDSNNPYADPAFSARPKPAAEESPQERLRRLMAERANRKAAEEGESSTRRVVKGTSAKISPASANRPVNLTHLVSDNSADAHLENALTTRPSVAPNYGRKKSAFFTSIAGGLKDREAVRKAVIMSIVLADPRSKTKKSPTFTPQAGKNAPQE